MREAEASLARLPLAQSSSQQWVMAQGGLTATHTTCCPNASLAHTLLAAEPTRAANVRWLALTAQPKVPEERLGALFLLLGCRKRILDRILR